MAVPVWVRNQGSVGATGGGTTYTPTLPSGMTVGNLMLMAVWVNRNPGGATVTTPSGWTRIVDGTTTFGSGGLCRLYVYAKVVASGETAPTLTASTSSTSFQVEISEYSGATTPLVGVGGATSSGTTVAVPAITTVSVDNLVVYVLGSNTDFDEVTASPAGATLRVHHQDATVGSYVAVADKPQATAATVAASSFTRNHTQFPCIAHTVAIPSPNPSGTMTKIKWGTNLAVTDEGVGVIRVDSSGGTPPDATTLSKGIVQLAGDLAGTAASPQIAAGVIVDADVAAANKDGTAATPSLRTLGTGSQQAAAGNDSRLLVAAIAYGTSLPASPTDGQEAILVDSVTAPNYQWRFRYNAGSTAASKWEFVGGNPVWTGLANFETTTSSTFVDLATVGPQLTVPRTGVYVIYFDVDLGNSTAGAGGKAGLKIGAAAVNDGIAINFVSATVNQDAHCATHFGINAAAGDVVKLQYRANGGGSCFFLNRNLSMVPVRVS